MSIEIKYDTPIEVTKEQYNVLVKDMAGVVAHREENGKYYIKVLLMQYAKVIEDFLKK